MLVDMFFDLLVAPSFFKKKNQLNAINLDLFCIAIQNYKPEFKQTNVIISKQTVFVEN